MRILKDILALMRPKQWIKNTFVLAPLALSQNISSRESVVLALESAAIFCLGSSSVYIWNDIVDRKRDREHREKSARPIAAGRISISLASALALFGSSATLAASYALDRRFFVVMVAYFVLNLSYSLLLKHIILIDLFAIAANYVLRIIGGTLVIDERITSWVIILATLLALFLALGKRRGEHVALQEKAEEHRPILRDYHPYFLDQLCAVITSAIVMAWIFYTLDPAIQARFNSPYLPLTIPFVLYGIFRYLYLIHRKGRGESPSDTLLADPPLLATVGLWFVCLVALRILGAKS